MIVRMSDDNKNVMHIFSYTVISYYCILGPGWLNGSGRWI